MDFTNKVVWITGASSGIGKALSLAFAKQGAQLILSARNPKYLEEVKALCKTDCVKTLPLDLENYTCLKDKADQALSLFGKIDILINNAGLSQRSLAMDTDMDVDKRLMAINYMGTVALSKALLPHFVSQGSGHLVTITSVVGKIGTPLRSSYAASKHALHGFFDSLRAEVHDKGINITLICPGYVNTNISMNALVGDGSPQNTMDKATANGLSPERFASRALKIIAQKKQEAVIGGFLEKLAVIAKRFFPKLLARMIRKIDVT